MPGPAPGPASGAPRAEGGTGMLDQCLVLCNGKGGVGKSSIAAALAAGAAVRGRRTLLVDLDPAGSVDQDLGYRQTGDSDDGRALHRAVVDGADLTPVSSVRTGLDVVPAGDFTHAVYARLAARDRRVPDVIAPLEALGRGYDLVIVDTPPATQVALDVAFCLARFLVLPVGIDTGSLDGLELVSDRYHVVRSRGLNPTLEPLGVVLFGMDPAEPRLAREVRADVSWELDGAAPVFDTVVRHRPRAARDLRRHGLVPSEYLRAVWDARLDPATHPGADRLDDGAAGLAEDYWDLTEEVLARMDERLTPRPAVAGSAPATLPVGAGRG
ncbi:MAG: ParA family protein [Microthrixaceae bacterium]|nr:ParA family protein [Microthrixaceae bacterium]